jgi:hypothetical protein
MYQPTSDRTDTTRGSWRARGALLFRCSYKRTVIYVAFVSSLHEKRSRGGHGEDLVRFGALSGRRKVIRCDQIYVLAKARLHFLTKLKDNCFVSFIVLDVPI